MSEIRKGPADPKMSDMIFECFQSAKINLKKAIASLGLKLWRVWFSQKVEKYIPNERQDRMHSFGI